MLQQTRVEAVKSYFERFLERFPDLRALAEASEEEVLEAWSGLGYYRRARMLRAGAQVVLERHAGNFPSDEGEALAVPGVGRYTAGAIRSIALGKRAAILDGNVTRVLTRYFGIRGDVSRAAVSRRLWEIASRAVERGEPAAVNQAQMELGATVCTPSNSQCACCPLASRCAARREGLVGILPELPRKRPTVDVSRTVLLVREGSRVLLRRRRADELLPGIWDLPGAFTGIGGDRSGGFADAKGSLPIPVRSGEFLGKIKHAITYRRIVLEVREAHPSNGGGSRRRPGSRSAQPLTGPDGAEFLWCSLPHALERALSSPARRILRKWGIPESKSLGSPGRT
jgi:A/G-specific adenine glycosylase